MAIRAPASAPYTSFGASRKKVNKAGDVLRDWYIAPGQATPQINEAWEGAWRYRSEFQTPLTSVVMGLRSMVNTVGAPVIVGQRLKRMPQVILKLVRHPHMDLSRMQDIGGCRAILPDRDAIDRAHRRMVKNRWQIVDPVDDYIARPKTTGYRGVHVTVLRQNRLIEVQLRTHSQHDWAEYVEAVDLRRRYGLKDGRGPKRLLRYLEMAAYALEETALGRIMPAEWDREFARVRVAAAPYL